MDEDDVDASELGLNTDIATDVADVKVVVTRVVADNNVF